VWLSCVATIAAYLCRTIFYIQTKRSLYRQIPIACATILQVVLATLYTIQMHAWKELSNQKSDQFQLHEFLFEIATRFFLFYGLLAVSTWIYLGPEALSNYGTAC